MKVYEVNPAPSVIEVHVAMTPDVRDWYLARYDSDPKFSAIVNTLVAAFGEAPPDIGGAAWLAMKTVSELRSCKKCDGCGKVADTDDQEPWSSWMKLPLESSLAVLTGTVTPIDCPNCGGTGKAQE